MSLEQLIGVSLKELAALFVVLAGVTMLSLWVAGDSRKPILLWKNALISAVAACLCIIPHSVSVPGDRRCGGHAILSDRAG